MSNADPWLLPIPRAFQQDPELLAYFEQLSRFLNTLWERSGGSDDGIEQIVDVLVGVPDATLPDGSTTTSDSDVALRTATGGTDWGQALRR